MIRKALPLALFILPTIAAHAQLAGYTTLSVERLSGITSSTVCSGSTGTSACNSSVNPLGFTVGASYGLRTIGPVRLGVDLRGSNLTSKRAYLTNFIGPGTRLYSGLGGIRASIQTPFHFVDPYVQGSAGIGRAPTGLPTSAGTGFEYLVFAGADVHVLPFADICAFEVGYGGLDLSSHNYPIKSISTGIVFHLPVAQ